MGKEIFTIYLLIHFEFCTNVQLLPIQKYCGFFFLMAAEI